MKERQRPILFRTDMVRAILDGRKTQTRRLSSTARTQCDKLHWVKLDASGYGVAASVERYFDCPYGVVGDRLWVRETFRVESWDEDGRADIGYPADGATRSVRVVVADFDLWVEQQSSRMMRSGARTPVTPSIHMPRWASRITLSVTGVRVERLQAISEADAKAEGFDDRMAFALRSGLDWNANPWVWVLSFDVVKGGAR